MAEQSARSAPLESLLLLTPRWARDGGIATHVAATAQALAAAGVAVEVVAGELDSAERPPGVRVHEAPLLMQRDATPAERLGPAAELDFEVAHLHQLEDPDLVPALRRRAPVAVSVHGYAACPSTVYYFRPGHECSRAQGPGCIPNLALRGCAHMLDPRPLPHAYRRAGRAARALREADLAISYSSAVDRHLAANGVARRRIVPLFATAEPPAAPVAEVPRRVVFAGRIVPSKGLATLIRAARDVQAEIVVCGDGWQLGAMRRLASRLGVAERVDFRGWLAPADLAVELARAAVLAFPSLWPEPFGLVGIEALAAGTPVVASATGGIEDWLVAGVSGLLFAPGDAAGLAARLRELLADDERRRQMGEAGRADVAERFTPRRHVEAVLEAYAAAREQWGRGRHPEAVPLGGPA